MYLCNVECFPDAAVATKRAKYNKGDVKSWYMLPYLLKHRLQRCHVCVMLPQNSHLPRKCHDAMELRKEKNSHEI
jgi:hypothetical protein